MGFIDKTNLLALAVEYEKVGTESTSKRSHAGDASTTDRDQARHNSFPVTKFQRKQLATYERQFSSFWLTQNRTI